MNWQIIVGALLLIGGLANITENFGAFLFGILKVVSETFDTISGESGFSVIVRIKYI